MQMLAPHPAGVAVDGDSSPNSPFGDKFGSLRPAEEIAQVCRAAGVSMDAPIVTSCGSGMTAAIVNLALHTVGAPQPRLYDGSWSEYGSEKGTPIVTGPLGEETSVP